jgi:hypothetical protein
MILQTIQMHARLSEFDAFQMDTMLHVEARVEDIFHWLKYEDITRITRELLSCNSYV